MEAPQEMSKDLFVVVKCGNIKCGRYTYGKIGQKSRTCPYCGKRINMEKRLVRIVKSADEARELVKKLNYKLMKKTLDDF